MARSLDIPTKGGFNFDLCRRNEMLLKKGIQLPSFRKTGTTIVGLVFQVLFFNPFFFIYEQIGPTQDFLISSVEKERILAIFSFSVSDV